MKFLCIQYDMMLVLSNETGCSHFPSCAFKSECENRTLVLLQRFVGLVLLELSELSSRAFSQSGNHFSRAVPFYISLLVYISLLITPCIIYYVTNKETLNLDDDAFVRFEETKDKYFNRSLRHGTEICVLIRF